jgi:hypothetical protein
MNSRMSVQRIKIFTLEFVNFYWTSGFRIITFNNSNDFYYRRVTSKIFTGTRKDPFFISNNMA